MGKASKWFRSIIGLKNPDSRNQTTSSSKRRWSFVKSYREKDTPTPKKSSVNGSINSNAKLPSSNGRQQLQQKDSVSVVASKGESQVVDPNMNAISVASATAAVADAAVAVAQAAAAVVRLTSSSGRSAREPSTHASRNNNSCRAREESAAVKIQSTFRGYLARRALRALKGLVRLQALVRGHIERKRTAEWLKSMQALLRAQARARAGRAHISESSQSSCKSSHFHHLDPATPEKFEYAIPSKSRKYEQSSVLKRNVSKSSGRTYDNHEKLHPRWNHRIDEQAWDQQVHSTRFGPVHDEKNDKILEVDTGKPSSITKRRNLFHSTHLALNSDLYSCSFTNSRESHQTAPTPSHSYGEVQSLTPLNLSQTMEETPFYDAADDNSPQFYSASSKGGSSKRSPFTPAKSDGSRSYLSGYSNHPNYMSYTKSSKAKLRSFSAPKHRPQYERSGSTKSYSIHGLGELKSNAQRSALHKNFASKDYPGSGRLDRLGMPVGYIYTR